MPAAPNPNTGNALAAAAAEATPPVVAAMAVRKDNLR